MKNLERLFQWFDDRLNPIVVKELRQAVQGRLVVSILILFLVVQLGALGMFLLAGETKMRAGHMSLTLGREAFMVMFGIMLGTCMLLVPVLTGMRLSAERSDAGVDLMFITTLRPRQIVWGKFLAGLVLTVVIYSACLPFITFTYLLRGIDLPSIFLVLAMGFFAVATAIQFAIFVACLPAGRILKSLFGLGAVTAVMYLFGGIMWMSFEMLRQGFGSRMGQAVFWGAAATAVLLDILAMWLLAAFSMALLMPPSANRALPVRVQLTVSWLLTGIACLLWSLARGDIDPIDGWMIMAAIVIAAYLPIAVSERDVPGARLRRTIARRPLWRAIQFIFYSGAGGGIVWSIVMILLTVGVSLVSMLWFRAAFPPRVMYSFRNNDFGIAAGCVLYIFCYTMSAAWLRRRFLARWLKTQQTWALACLLFALGAVVPPIVATFVLMRPLTMRADWGWMLGSPLVLDRQYSRGPALLILCVWAAAVLALNFPWIARQIHAFRPLKIEKEPQATQEPAPATAPASLATSDD